MFVIQRNRVKAVWLDWKGRHDWCTCLHQRHFEDRRCTDSTPPSPVRMTREGWCSRFAVMCGIRNQIKV